MFSGNGGIVLWPFAACLSDTCKVSQTLKVIIYVDGKVHVFWSQTMHGCVPQASFGGLKLTAELV